MGELLSDDTGQIRQVLDYLGRELEPSILIGGWATFFRVGGDISHDIDLIIGSPEIRDRVRDAVSGVSESRHLRGGKWRGEVDGVHIDVYVPHESELGATLRLRVEVLAGYTESLGPGNWRLLTIEAHTISKFAALLDRPDSEKGAKDAREIVRLIEKGVDPVQATAIALSASAAPIGDLRSQIQHVFHLLKSRAGMNKEQRRRFDMIRREWDEAMVAILPTEESFRPPLD